MFMDLYTDEETKKKINDVKESLEQSRDKGLTGIYESKKIRYGNSQQDIKDYYHLTNDNFILYRDNYNVPVSIEREQFNKLKQDIASGKVTNVIVKNVSQISRIFDEAYNFVSFAIDKNCMVTSLDDFDFVEFKVKYEKGTDTRKEYDDKMNDLRRRIREDLEERKNIDLER